MARTPRPRPPTTLVRVAAGAALLALAAPGCTAPDPLPTRGSEAPPHRPSDGLLERPDLQRLVEAQEARDTAVLVEAARSAVDPTVRARAAFALGSVRAASARPVLLALLEDADPRVRGDAAFALGQLPDGASVELVGALERETDATVRGALVEAVGKAGDLEAARALLSTSVEEGLLPAHSLALSRTVMREVAPPETVDTLVARLRHPDPGVRVSSAYFLGRVEDLRVWWSHRLDVRSALGSWERDDPAAMHVLRGFRLGMDLFNTERATSWLRTSPDWRIRVSAAVALGGRPDLTPTAAEALVDALDDPNPNVRVQAATVLGSAPPLPGVGEAVAEWVRENPDDTPVVAPLLELLAMVGRDDVVLERVRAGEPDDETAWLAALRALEALAGEEAVRELGRAAREGPPRVAGRAMASLLSRWDLSRPYPEAHAVFDEVLRSVLDPERPGPSLGAAAALADTVFVAGGSVEALLALDDALEAGPTRDSLRVILAGIDDPAARERAGAATTEPGAGGAEDRAAPAESGESRRPPVRPSLDWRRLAELGPSPRLVLETERGRVVLRLLPEEAPLTVQAITALAAEGRYDGVPFHRVVPNFVVQGGDVSAGDGSGGPGFRLRSELTRIPYVRGVLGMARTSAYDTEGSQFFVTHSMARHLDGAYTAFGWVESGMEVVDRIRLGDRVIEARVVPGS